MGQQRQRRRWRTKEAARANEIGGGLDGEGPEQRGKAAAPGGRSPDAAAASGDDDAATVLSTHWPLQLLLQY